MNKTLIELYEALERLKQGKSIHLGKNFKINNDTVALESGRQRGFIKKSRPLYEELINDILIASQDNSKKNTFPKEKINKCKEEKKVLNGLLQKFYNRELMYLQRIKDLESALAIHKNMDK